jgi:O-methyltransferase
VSRRDHPWLNRIPPAIARFNLTLTKFSQSKERRQILKLFLERLHERRCLLQPIEAAQLILALEAVKKIPGDMAEVGSFEGVSAKLLAMTDRTRTLHIFDTFEGLPDPGEEDSRGFYTGQYRASEADVQRYLQEFNVRIYKGLFPSTAGPIADKHFAFVHLDVDLYESTKACLEFFYPRMKRGGIILTHDYAAREEGVYKAFESFFAEKPEPVIELGGNQGMVVKLD